MKIGMIGAGSVALAIARYALASGHEVLLSNSRGPETLADVVNSLPSGVSAATIAEAGAADLTILATPWLAVEAALSAVTDWSGRVLIDATNPFVQTTPKLVLAELGEQGASEIIANLAPGARVVKAFNSVYMSNFVAGATRDAARRVLFVSGDDKQAKSTVTELISSFGFIAVDLGSLASGGRLQQAGGPLAGHDFLISENAN